MSLVTSFTSSRPCLGSHDARHGQGVAGILVEGLPDHIDVDRLVLQDPHREACGCGRLVHVHDIDRERGRGRGPEGIGGLDGDRVPLGVLVIEPPLFTVIWPVLPIANSSESTSE